MGGALTSHICPKTPYPGPVLRVLQTGAHLIIKTIPSVEMRKLRHREIKSFAQESHSREEEKTRFEPRKPELLTMATNSQTRRPPWGLNTTSPALHKGADKALREGKRADHQGPGSAA